MSDSDSLINRSGSDRRCSWNRENIFENTIRPCVYELIGVAMFVFIGTTAICSGSVALEGIALAHGLAIALLIVATGSISGGHLNPAVTLGVLLAGAITPVQALLYVVSQLIGGIFGAAFTLAVVGGNYDAHAGGGHILPNTSTPLEAVFCEILLTYLLVTTVLLVAVDDTSKNSLGPLAVGFAVTVDILAGGGVSGASMNPARSFGPAVIVGKWKVWEHHWIYWVGPLTGSVISGVIYRLFLAGPEKRVLQRICHTLN